MDVGTPRAVTSRIKFVPAGAVGSSERRPLPLLPPRPPLPGRPDLGASNVITWRMYYGNATTVEEALVGSRGV